MTCLVTPTPARSSSGQGWGRVGLLQYGGEVRSPGQGTPSLPYPVNKRTALAELGRQECIPLSLPTKIVGWRPSPLGWCPPGNTGSTTVTYTSENITFPRTYLCVRKYWKYWMFQLYIPLFGLIALYARSWLEVFERLQSGIWNIANTGHLENKRYTCIFLQNFDNFLETQWNFTKVEKEGTLNGQWDIT